MTKDELLKKLHAAKAADSFGSDLFNDLIDYFDAPIEKAAPGELASNAWDLIIHVVTISEVKAK